MNKFLWMAGWLVALVLSGSTQADFVPNYISYEGTVLDEFGQPGAGSRTLYFSLMDTNGAVRWQEGHLNVPLSPQGAFQLLLGKIVPLPALEPSWRLNVELKTGSSSWKNLAPPQSMTTVFYALQADDARRAPGDLIVKQDVRVSGSLMATSGLVSASRLNTAEVTADSARAGRLAVSDLRGPSNTPVTVSGGLELTQGLVVKGSVSLMKVMDLNATLATNLSGRVYLLAVPRTDVNCFVRVTFAAGGVPRTYQSNLPNGVLFIPMDMRPGDRIQFYDKNLTEIPVNSWQLSHTFRSVKVVKMGL